jgi:hypothetical protein
MMISTPSTTGKNGPSPPTCWSTCAPAKEPVIRGLGGAASIGTALTVTLDASETYDLTTVLQGFEPHPQQGWHVKLTVNNDGSQGADVKHKVFWVSGCETPPTTSTSTTSTTEKPTTTSTTEKPTTTSTTEKPTTTSTTQASTTSTTEASTTTMLGSSTSTTSIVSSPVGELPRTGNGTGPLLTLAGTVLLLGGAALLGSAQLSQKKQLG